MTDAQIKHLQEAQGRFLLLSYNKYERGTREHGGELWAKSVLFLLEEAIFENIDQFMYLFTAWSQEVKRLEIAGTLPEAKHLPKPNYEPADNDQTEEPAIEPLPPMMQIPAGAPLGIIDIVKEFKNSAVLYPGPYTLRHLSDVLAEEVHELNMEMWKRPTTRDKQRIASEAIQVAATALHIIEEARKK